MPTLYFTKRALGSLRSTFTALRERNYRRYTYGQMISMTGSFMQQVMQAWLVYQMSGSAAWIGIIAFCQQAPAFVVSAIAGVYADRKDRRKVLIWVQVAGAAQAALLTALFFSGHLQIWHVAVLSVLLSAVNAFEIVTRHAFASDLVSKPMIGSAIAMNSVVVNGTRIVGPALAGLMIGLLPHGAEGACFAINTLSFAPVLYWLVTMEVPPRARVERRAATPARQLLDAARYIQGAPVIRSLILLSVFLSFFGFPYQVLLPVFATELAGPGVNGGKALAWLTGIFGLGAIVGAVRSGRPRSLRQASRDITRAVILLGVSFIGLGLSARMTGSLIAVACCGLFLMGCFPLINTVIQGLVEDSMRGRVLALYTMTFFGAAPLGSLLAGWLADSWGARGVTVGMGVVCVVAGLGMALHRRRQPSAPDPRLASPAQADNLAPRISP
jgi:MFS family permease